MYRSYSTELCNIILRHNDAYIPSWYEFQNFVTIIEIWLLHSQPFTNTHFHFLIIVKLATSQVLLQQPKQITS